MDADWLRRMKTRNFRTYKDASKFTRALVKDLYLATGVEHFATILLKDGTAQRCSWVPGNYRARPLRSWPPGCDGLKAPVVLDPTPDNMETGYVPPPEPRRPKFRKPAENTDPIP